MTIVLTFLLAYLVGSIPFGVLVTRALGLGDLRSIGSGNIGATNVLRTGNKGAAAATLLLDAGKGAVAVLAARALAGEEAAMVAGLAAFLGHLFPVWLKFRGGKGVATFLGVTLALAWPAGLAACATWLAVAYATRFSSLAALAAAASVPVWLAVFGRMDAIWFGVALAALVWIRHHANIRRLLDGSEPKIGQGALSSPAVTGEQLILFAILAATLALFVWGRWRHDTVALGALIACVAAGLVPAGSAFDGFANPAVITVACVLVLSHGLQTSGAVDLMARGLLPESAGPSRMILGLTAASAVLSAFMNNVAALTLLMPVGLQAARRLDLTAGARPDAARLRLAARRHDHPDRHAAEPDRVGLPRASSSVSPSACSASRRSGSAVALAGVLFIGLVGWRLVPGAHPCRRR